MLDFDFRREPKRKSPTRWIHRLASLSLVVAGITLAKNLFGVEIAYEFGLMSLIPTAVIWFADELSEFPTPDTDGILGESGIFHSPKNFRIAGWVFLLVILPLLGLFLWEAGIVSG